MLAIYQIDTTLDRTYMLADLSQASSPIWFASGDGMLLDDLKDDDWSESSWQVADARHDPYTAAIMYVMDTGRNYYADPNAEVIENDDGQVLIDGLHPREYIRQHVLASVGCHGPAEQQEGM